MGIYENVFVPCFIGRFKFPMLLRILCVVEDVYVNIHIPKKDGFEVTFWPPYMLNEMATVISEQTFEVQGEESIDNVIFFKFFLTLFVYIYL